MSRTLLQAGSFLWLFGVTQDEEGDYACLVGGVPIQTFYLDVLGQ